MYIFTKSGKVQYFKATDSRGEHYGLIVCFDETVARQAGKERNISPALVGSVQNETEEGQLAAAMEHGAEGLWILENANGTTTGRFVAWEDMHD